MAYTAETITAGDSILASWGNKVETHLARLGNYMGVVANVASLPAVGTVSEGDWYWCKAERLAKMKVGSVYLTLNGVGEVASSAPTTVTGLLWYDTTNKVFKIYSGSAWIQIGGITIDPTAALSSLQNALTAQDPALVLAALANSSFANYLLSNSALRSELVTKRLYMNALMKFALSTVDDSNDYMDAVLGATKWSYASEMSDIWGNTTLLNRWLSNFWTQYRYNNSGTISIDAVNGQYGIVCIVNNSYSTPSYISMNIDFTGFDDLDFWAEITKTSTAANVILKIDSTTLQSWSDTTSGANYNYDVSGYTGVHNLQFLYSRNTTLKITSLRLS